MAASLRECSFVPIREGLFEGAWSKAAREEHIIARLAFVQEMFARSGHAEVLLHRGIATDTKPEGRTGLGFVSARHLYGIPSTRPLSG